MKQIDDLNQVRLENTVITLGKFDGCHIGHRKLFEKAVQLREKGRCAVIFTFNIHPSKLLSGLSPETPENRRLILTRDEQTDELYPEGIDYLVRFPFDRETREMSPETFVEKILVGKLGVKDIVCGTDFRFGKDRRGNTQILQELGRTFGFDVHVVEKVRIRLEGEEESRVVSSSLIKKEILSGNMENARALLGRPFFVRGEVLHGKHLGSRIGFPTINQIVPEDKILPPDGVYATRTKIRGEWYDSITNVGIRPTFDDGKVRTVETNLFGFDRDVYSETAEVAFFRFIRPEKQFASAEELAERIEKDKAEVVTILLSGL